MPDNNNKQELKQTKKTAASQSKPKAVRSKLNRRLVSILLTIAAVLFVIVGAIYYFAVRQNPTNIVMDSVVNTIEAKSIKTSGDIRFTVERLGANVDVKFTADKADKDGATDAKITYTSPAIDTPLVVNAKAIVASNGDLYIKLDNAGGAVSTMYKEMNSAYSRVQAPGGVAQTPISSQIVVDMGNYLNDKWIKIPANSNDETFNDAFGCMQKTVAKFNANSAGRDKLVQAYKANDFLVIDNKSLPKDGGSDGYRLSIDSVKFKAFKTAAKNTEVGKIFDSCAKSTSSGQVSEDVKTGSLNVWVDRQSHNITRIQTDTDNKDFKVDIRLDVGASTNVTIPAGAKTFQEIFTAPTEESAKS